MENKRIDIHKIKCPLCGENMSIDSIDYPTTENIGFDEFGRQSVVIKQKEISTVSLSCPSCAAKLEFTDEKYDVVVCLSDADKRVCRHNEQLGYEGEEKYKERVRRNYKCN